MTAEEAGRKVRYEAFGMTAADLLRRGIAAQDIAIAVAQNANDQAETILFRILRGTGTDGLAGIKNDMKRYAGRLRRKAQRRIARICVIRSRAVQMRRKAQWRRLRWSDRCWKRSARRSNGIWQSGI